MAVLLRGLKVLAKSASFDLSRITAIITMFDDGGSSGRIMEEYDILPPGDIRNCLVAFSDEDLLMSRLFRHRFAGNGPLGGHSVGNLLLTALTHLNGGDFRKAVYDAGRVLAVKGTILPSTLQSASLCARLDDGTIISGESRIRLRQKGSRVESLSLQPKREGESKVTALEDCLKAIKEADMIVIGPGSLYTSLLPNLLVEGIPEAIKSSSALKVFACNIMTESGETDGFGVSSHVAELARLGGIVPDWVLLNTEELPSHALSAYEREGAVQVLPDDCETVEISGSRVLAMPLLGELEIEEAGGRKTVYFHDPIKLAQGVMELVSNGHHIVINKQKQRRNDVSCGAH